MRRLLSVQDLGLLRGKKSREDWNIERILYCEKSGCEDLAREGMLSCASPFISGT